jgi:hypothetical protein
MVWPGHRAAVRLTTEEKTMSKECAAVTKAALIKRINRKLALEGETLRTTRGERWRGDLGDHYTVDESNFITAQHVDLVECARELGVLKASEDLACEHP